MRAVALSLCLLAFTACKKDEGKADKPADKPAATATTGTVAGGVRRIEVSATADGYQPDKIPGKPGEKLVLVFTRKVDASCLSQLKTPDGKLVDLPLDKPVEVPVTVPQTGQVDFACGMDMFHGVVVAQP